MANRLSKIKLKEVSLVDNPAEPNATIEFFKAADMGQEVEEAVRDMPGSRSTRVRRRRVRRARGGGEAAQARQRREAERRRKEEEEKRRRARAFAQQVSQASSGAQEAGLFNTLAAGGLASLFDKATRFFSADTRRELAGRGAAMPDGSFPIPDKDALRRAIMSIGRTTPAKRSAVRQHIRRRAKALGATDMLPASWSVGGE